MIERCHILVALVLTWLVLASPAGVRARDVHDIDGAALEVGFGAPGLSLSASYYVQWPSKNTPWR